MNIGSIELGQSLKSPSSRFLPPPSVEFFVPQNWEPQTVTGTTAAARLNLGIDTFSPNVVITAERRTEEWRYVADSQLKVIQNLPEVVLIDEYEQEISSAKWQVWVYAFSDVRAGTLVQVVAMTSSETATSVHTVSFVGSVAAAQSEELVPILRAILQSTSLRDGAVD